MEEVQDDSGGDFLSNILDGIDSLAKDVVPFLQSVQPAPARAPGAPPPPQIAPTAPSAVPVKQAGIGIGGLVIAAAVIYFIIK